MENFLSNNEISLEGYLLSYHYIDIKPSLSIDKISFTQEIRNKFNKLVPENINEIVQFVKEIESNSFIRIEIMKNR